MATDVEIAAPNGAATASSSTANGAPHNSNVATTEKTYKWGRYTWLKRLWFLDVDRLIRHGYRQRLEPQDMYAEPTVNTRHLLANFDPALKAQLQAGELDLKRVVLSGNVGILLFTGLLYLVAQACTLAGPLLLNRIVKGLTCQGLQKQFGPSVQCEEKTQLYYYCIGLFLAPALQSMCENHQTFLLYLCGTRMRNSLMASIYRKCLRLSNAALQEESTGKVVTLMSNDAQKLQDAMMAIHALWGSPCYIIAVLVLLWFQVGWATFVGLGVMLTLVPATGKLAAKLGSLRREIMQWTDKRIGLMNEVISGIQMIKFYAWETSFAKAVMGARSQEARILKTTAYWQGWFGVLLFSGPVAVAVFCFGSYTLSGKSLSNADAYTALALFSLLRFPMSFLPMLITMIVNALIALKRIGAFLQKPEALLSDETHAQEREQGVVRVTGGSFAWDNSTEKPVLKNIQFEAKPGSLTMVVGTVGSGKSSVLAALTGQMLKRGGEVFVGGRIAYVAQTAWIMNDTLQENVLLGAELDADRYTHALDVSQLGPDLEILPNGDLTEIGDRGITLSGGQKQRVSIARSVYARADVYLMDDPLSAVDSHVGRALFEQCIRGPLRDKTVILVTNALQYLPHADTILWMEDGAIKAQGSYTQLVEAGLNIAELAHAEDEELPTDQVTPAARVSERGAAKPLLKPLLKPVFSSNKVTLTRQATGANKNLTGVEERESGSIGWNVVKMYFMSGGGWPVILSLLGLYGLEQGARVYTDRWVGIWFGDKYNQSLGFYLAIYFGLGVLYALIVFFRSLDFLYLCVNAALSIHNKLLDHILMLPKTFFDTNPAGRILNRFSRDTDIMDATLSASLIQFVGCVVTYIAILIVIAIANYWFVLALVPLTIIYFAVQRYYIPTARELQRIESISRSPIYSKFGEALLGVATIRAYRLESHFTSVSDELMEGNAFAFVTQKLAASWLAMRLDLLGLMVLTGTGALMIQGNVDPGLAGLALVYALDLTRFLKHGTNMASKSEADFNSVERIVQYLKPTPEAEPETQPQILAKMDKEWPSKGAMTVTKLCMRYRPDMPLVLKGISFDISAGEKVGVVGRTGSGKSSLFMALFRMVEAESGSIVIDGVDIGTLGVRHLRSKMSIIPQDPFMFSGTVRHNLDPFEEHGDERLWSVLEAVGLKPVISELEGKLLAKVVDNGANFSLGQRQLFCMARAMLRNSRVLMLDEATASMDLDTDQLIQNAIRSAFVDCTMLTIAHRLNTIIDSDRVLVLDNGVVVENDDADNLLRKDKGIFSGMVEQTGRSSARYLRGLAATFKSQRIKSVGNLSRLASGDNLTPSTSSNNLAGADSDDGLPNIGLPMPPSKSRLGESSPAQPTGGQSEGASTSDSASAIDPTLSHSSDDIKIDIETETGTEQK